MHGVVDQRGFSRLFMGSLPSLYPCIGTHEPGFHPSNRNWAMNLGVALGRLNPGFPTCGGLRKSAPRGEVYELQFGAAGNPNNLRDAGVLDFE